MHTKTLHLTSVQLTKYAYSLCLFLPLSMPVFISVRRVRSSSFGRSAAFFSFSLHLFTTMVD